MEQHANHQTVRKKGMLSNGYVAKHCLIQTDDQYVRTYYATVLGENCKLNSLASFSGKVVFAATVVHYFHTQARFYVFFLHIH